MKATSKRGSAVLDAPEESLVPESEWAEREPAPAGTLHRGNVEDYSTEVEEDEYDQGWRRQGLGVRLRGGVPKSVVGRVALGVGVLVCLGAVGASAMAARSYLIHDERFVIPASSEIQTEGNSHLTRAQLLSVFGADVERNIFKVPLEERRADLERLPWVAHATVMRLLPNKIRVTVTERTPVAFVRQGTHIGLVDAQGVLLDMPENAAGDPQYSFPVLSGLAESDPLSTRAARMEIYRRFVNELDATGEKISDTLSEVDVSNPEDVKALIPSGGTDILVHFGDEDFLTRYRHFQTHLPEWKTQYPHLASADMRYERQVVLEMQPGTGVPVTDGGAASIEAAAKTAATPVTKAALEAAAEKMAKTVPAAEKAAPKANLEAAKGPGPAVRAAAPAHAPAAVHAAPVHAVKAAPVAVKAAPVPVAGRHAAGKGVSAANERMFAALAAARKAQLAGQGKR